MEEAQDFSPLCRAWKETGYLLLPASFYNPSTWLLFHTFHDGIKVQISTHNFNKAYKNQPWATDEEKKHFEGTLVDLSGQGLGDSKTWVKYDMTIKEAKSMGFEILR
ncbi:hypothetical protein H633G_11322 [Metarhizium anisopliae BRIP 53284]|nr:hypothetical protein H633G_11322 [Metarhizium anisopliae BRIP 53284]